LRGALKTDMKDDVTDVKAETAGLKGLTLWLRMIVAVALSDPLGALRECMPECTARWAARRPGWHARVRNAFF
jgi:hypothetical protein